MASIETLLPNSFLMIHQTVLKIIKENKLYPIEDETIGGHF